MTTTPSSLDESGTQLRLQKGDRLHCLSGRLWITEIGKEEDQFLMPGEALSAASPRCLWVSGLPRARYRLELASKPSVPRQLLGLRMPLTY